MIIQYCALGSWASFLAVLFVAATSVPWTMAQEKQPAAGDPAEENLGVHGYADSSGVQIHFVTRGSGPLVVMIHGFPDYGYTWRQQMPAIAENHQVVAIDQRGYNWSDQPEGVEAYAMERLVGDVLAVVKHFERDQAIIVGHDWGGMVAWQFADVRTEGTSGGAVVGSHFVTVTEGWAPGQEVPVDNSGMQKSPPRGPWAQKYRDSSSAALKVEVVRGQKNHFEFDLSK